MGRARTKKYKEYNDESKIIIIKLQEKRRNLILVNLKSLIVNMRRCASYSLSSSRGEASFQVVNETCVPSVVVNTDSVSFFLNALLQVINDMV